MKARLTASQVLLLQALAEAPQGMTSGELEKKTGVRPGTQSLGPIYQETLDKHPNSLYGRKMVTAMRWAEDQDVIFKITVKGRETAQTFSAKRHLSPNSGVPPKLLDPAVIAVRATKTYGLELFTENDLQQVLDLLPKKYHQIPLNDLRQRIVNRRKQGAFTQEKEVPEWYRTYRKTAAFRQTRTKALAFYHGCAFDTSHPNGLEVYHRAFYDADGNPILNQERPEDLIVLCSQCWRRNRKYLCSIPEALED